MKGLSVNSDRCFVLQGNLTRAVVEQDEVLVKARSASVSPFDADSAERRFDTYFTEYRVEKEVQSGLEFLDIIDSGGL